VDKARAYRRKKRTSLVNAVGSSLTHKRTSLLQTSYSGTNTLAYYKHISLVRDKHTSLVFEEEEVCVCVFEGEGERKRERQREGVCV